MQYTYLVGEGPEAQAVIAEAERLYNIYQEALLELWNDFPDGTSRASSGGNCVSGFLRAENKPFTAVQMRTLGVRVKRLVKNCPEAGQYEYVPDSRTKAGRVLEEKIAFVNAKATSCSDAVINTLHLGRTLYKRMDRRLHSSAALAKGGKLYIIIPGTPDDKSGVKFPEIPAWLRAPRDEEREVFEE
jgi:hypothetical protein